MVLLLILAPGLAVYHGNPTGFIRFGREFVKDTRPPAGAIINSKTGYDGQYFWAMAQDPLLLRDDTVSDFNNAGFRLERVVYPTVAYVLAAGQSSAIPWTLLLVNVAAVLAITVAFSAYARRRGRSGWWGLVAGLLPGFEFAVMGDLSCAVAVGCMIGGLILWERRRVWPAAGLLSLAVLTREPMAIAVMAVAVDALVQWWSVRGDREAVGELIRRTAPVVALPTAAFLLWHMYVLLRHGVAVPPANEFDLTGGSLLHQFSDALKGGPSLTGLWDVACLTTILIGIGAAIARLRQGIDAASVSALLFGLVLAVLTYGSEWGYTRESAPMFAALLLAGLPRRSRPAIAVCITVAVLGALVPFVLA
jgi:hypothetical protein